MKFTYFPQLPKEMQCLIWEFASVVCYSRAIPFIIPLGIAQQHPKWHHVFNTPRDNPLLSACRGSREATLQYHKLLPVHGFETLLNCDYITPRGMKEGKQCPIKVASKARAEKSSWNPNTDLVLLRGGLEPFACGRKARCSAVDNEDFIFHFDKSLKYLAMPADLWALYDEITLHAAGLEVVFLLMDHETVDKLKKLKKQLQKPNATRKLSVEMGFTRTRVPHRELARFLYIQSLISGVLEANGKPLTFEEKENLDSSRINALHECGICTSQRNISIEFVFSVEDAFKHIDYREKEKRDAGITTGQSEYEQDISGVWRHKNSRLYPDLDEDSEREIEDIDHTSDVSYNWDSSEDWEQSAGQTAISE